MAKVNIFTDGACLGNPGPGGWAYLLQYGEHEKLVAGAEEQTTNNRMELQAVIRALEALKKPCEIDLFTDSQYVRKGMMEWVHTWQKNAWRTSGKEPVKNQDLWQELIILAQTHTTTWHWVRGHSGHIENERVDRAAREAAEKEQRSRDETDRP